MIVDALRNLADKVEAGGYDNVTAFEAFDGKNQNLIADAFGGSLDAAKALHDAVLPNSPLDIVLTGGYSRVSIYSGPKAPFHARNESVARAWLLAILKALIAQEVGQ